MKRLSNFFIGFLCGAILFGGTIALANSGVLAQITTQLFFYNGEPIELLAYNINGNNYVKLRDAAALFGVDIEYVEDTNSVFIGKASEDVTTEEITVPEMPEGTTEEIPIEVPLEQKDESINIDGTSFSREDFSSNANAQVFDDVYTREAYNTMRQTVADKTEIIQGSSGEGYNPDYKYAHYVDEEFTFETPGKTDIAMKSVAAVISGYYTYTFGAEPTVKNLYEYPGYRILKVQINPKYEAANKAMDEFIESLDGLSDREKVKRIAEYIADRIVYKDENVAGINDVFTADAPVNGICGTYSNSFIYLCQRADIPCVSIRDATHAWNEIYIDGTWKTVDISYYDVARIEESLFPTNYPRTDITREKTEFAKELLVPNSTAE
jgi:hypothetical protein